MILILFARLWGQKESKIFNNDDIKLAKFTRDCDCVELEKLLRFWEEEYFQQTDIKDPTVFFEKKLMELFKKQNG